MKKIHFMAGMPRSGSTLLTTLLNQNPEIYASHSSHLQQAMKDFIQGVPNYESVKYGYRVNGYQQVFKNMAQSFYEDIDKPIIIDKSRAWCTRYSIDLAQQIAGDVKIIFPTRPILEVLASFVNLAENNPDNFIDKSMRNDDFWPYYYRPINDARCDWLMHPNYQMDGALFGYALSQQEEYKNMFCLVEYEDLCADPQGELNKIYDFLGLDRYNHNFLEIESKEELHSGRFFGIPDIHRVGKSIEKSLTSPESVLSDYVLNKYGNALSSLKNRAI